MIHIHFDSEMKKMIKSNNFMSSIELECFSSNPMLHYGLEKFIKSNELGYLDLDIVFPIMNYRISVNSFRENYSFLNLAL